MTDPFTDRDALQRDSYRTPDKLETRSSLYRFQDPPVDLVAWALSHQDWTGGEQVLDVGCGNGRYLRRLVGRVGALVGVDLSIGMLVAAPAAVPRAVADAQVLPFSDGSFDVVLAMHMLYHLPDIEAGVAELRRVLRPGGTLLAVTNHRDHLREMGQLFQAAGGGWGRSALRFHDGNGAAMLGSSFVSVEWHEVRSVLRIPNSALIIDYLETMRHHLEAGTDDWDATMAGMARLIGAGATVLTNAPGLFVCVRD